MSNVENLRNDLDIMSTPHAKTGKTNLWDVAVSINRTNPVPLDKSSIIFEDKVTKTEGNTTVEIPGTKIEDAAKEATAYPGQIISGLGGTDGKVYVLQPTDHSHKTHVSELLGTETVYPTTKTENGETVEDTTKTVGSATTTYEELAYQSTVDRLVNEEVYRRKVSDKARRESDLAIINFLGGGGNLPSETDVIADLNLPEELSDTSKTNEETTKTVLDYVVETVAAEKRVRTASDEVLAKYIGTATPSFTDKDGLIGDSLILPSTLSNTEGHNATTVLGYVEKTVAAEKTVREQATKDLATFIGTNVSIADAGDTILSDLTLPEILSDRTPNTTTTLLEYIKQTVDAEVQKRYNQDKVLLDCINNLDLQRAVAVEETTQDGILTLNLEAKLRDSSSDIVEAAEDPENTPLRKYNN